MGERSSSKRTVRASRRISSARVMRFAFMAGLVAMLCPRPWAMSFLPYYGDTLFGVAIAAGVALLGVGRRLPVSIWAPSMALFVWSALISSAVHGVSRPMDARLEPRILLGDALVLIAFVGGRAMMRREQARAIRSLSHAAFGSSVWGLLVLGLIVAGVLPVTLSEGRVGDQTLYLCCGVAFLCGPFLYASTVWLPARAFPATLSVSVGLMSLTRTSVGLGALAICQWALASGQGKPRIGLALLVAMSLALPAYIMADGIASEKQQEVFDSTGRVEELVEYLSNLTPSMAVVGIGVGRGFARLGKDAEGHDVELTSDTLHIDLVRPVFKFGLVISLLLGYALCRVVLRALRAKSHESARVALILLCSLLGLIAVGSVSGCWRAFPAFVLGCAISLSAPAGAFARPAR